MYVLCWQSQSGGIRPLLRSDNYNLNFYECAWRIEKYEQTGRLISRDTYYTIRNVNDMFLVHHDLYIPMYLGTSYRLSSSDIHKWKFNIVKNIVDLPDPNKKYTIKNKYSNKYITCIPELNNPHICENILLIDYIGWGDFQSWKFTKELSFLTLVY